MIGLHLKHFKNHKYSENVKRNTRYVSNLPTDSSKKCEKSVLTHYSQQLKNDLVGPPSSGLLGLIIVTSR